MRMAATAKITGRVDENVKAEFEKVLDGLGITVSAALTMFAKATIRQQALPFPLALDPAADPKIRISIEQEVERRMALASNPNPNGKLWYSTQEARTELGI